MKEADAFLALLERGEAQQAYDRAASGFRAATTLAAFRTFGTDVPFDGPDAAAWGWRTLSFFPLTARMGGVLALAGEHVPATISFVREGGGWKVRKLSFDRTASDRAALPADADVLALVRATMADFRRALVTGDFASFYHSISSAWRGRTSPDELKNDFVDFLGVQPELQALTDGSPLLSARPSLDQDNLLDIRGTYDAPQGKTIRFALRYTFEKPAWKLLSLEVEVGAGE